MMPPIKDIKEPDLALAGLALLIIFGLLIWYDRPIESSRPVDPYAQHQDPNTTGHAYESRFWEDPFAFDPPDPKEEKSKGYCKKQLIEEITAIKNPVKILAPLLKVRPDTTENSELRTRHRYAVIAGLIESGYRPLKPGYRPLAPGHRPLEPGHLHFCSSQENSSKQEYDVRWEHYSRESQDESDKGKSDIIVIWMNSEIFVDNNKFGRMSGSLFKSEEISQINFSIYDLNNILDQKRSAWITEKINRINDENCKNKGIELDGVQTDDKALTKKLAEELKLRNIKESSEEVMIITEYDSENARNLSRSFSESLYESFGKCKPVKSSTEAQSTSTDNNSESSTCEIKDVFYLKGVDAYQQQKIDKQDKNEDQAADKRARRLSVMGLSNSPPLPIGPGQVDYVYRLAEQIKGPHHDLNLEKRDSGIKAVGIFGSDFYDKLLLIKALRAEMPHILVFTTGLDAQMLHPQHWRSARNLVVASHFDLVLKDKEQHQKQSYQEKFHVFRDSRQTNIFYRTIEIVTNDVTRFEIPQPRIFEVGRNGFVHLASSDKSTSDDVLDKTIKRLARIFGWSPDTSASDDALDKTIKRLGLLAAIIFFLIWFHRAFRPNSRRLSIYLLLGELVILFIALPFATDESGEPLSFTDGTSLWPTIFIQIIAVLLAFAFCCKAISELDGNFCRLNEKYFQEAKLDEARSEWKVLVLPWSALIFGIVFYASNDVYPLGFPFKWCLVFLLLILVPYLREIEPWDFVSIKRWRQADNRHAGTANSNRNCCGIFRALRRLCIFNRPDNLPVSFHYFRYEDILWREYYNYGLVEHRQIRVASMWLFFAIIETIVIYLLPPWPLPCRGPTCGWASWTGVLSFSLIMILLFFVLDAVRLSFYWIQKLRTQHSLLADRIDFGALNNAIGNNLLPLESLERMITVVAERTQVVDRLIYYPMLCIILMLFAKITYFDNQDFPLSKGITFAASISLLFFSGFLIRYEAEKLKRSVIESAENLGKNKICKRREVERTIDRINGISDGAFKPMFEQPVMRSLLIILLSVGIFAGKYLNLFG